MTFAPFVVLAIRGGVSLELFNCLCILPSTEWNVSLNNDALGGIQASTMDSLVEGSSYQALMSTQASIFISEKDMISEWIQDGGHLELVDSPYRPPVPSKLGHARNPFLERSTTPSNAKTLIHPCRRASAPGGRVIKRIAHQTKRRIIYHQHWDILLKCGVASFARLLEINVDANGHIGPLIDSFPSRHTGGFRAHKVQSLFWNRLANSFPGACRAQAP
jgi:hypothetical protein